VAFVSVAEAQQLQAESTQQLLFLIGLFVVEVANVGVKFLHHLLYFSNTVSGVEWITWFQQMKLISKQ